MPRLGPEDREQEFVPLADAQDKGFWGIAVSEHPNEAYTATEIVKRAPGGPIGTDRKEAAKAQEAQKPSPAKRSDDK